VYLFFESSYFTSWIINLHFRCRKHPFLYARIFREFINLFPVKAFHYEKKNIKRNIFNKFFFWFFNWRENIMLFGSYANFQWRFRVYLSGVLRLRNYRVFAGDHAICSWFSIFACFCGSHSNILSNLGLCEEPIRLQNALFDGLWRHWMTLETIWLEIWSFWGETRFVSYYMVYKNLLRTIIVLILGCGSGFGRNMKAVRGFECAKYGGLRKNHYNRASFNALWVSTGN